MSVVARTDSPESGVEFDVRVEARPRTPQSPNQRRWDGDTLYVVSSEVGGRRALVDLDLTQCEKLALRFTLVSIDGREPGYDTPQIRVGVMSNAENMPQPFPLAVPTWSAIADSATRLDFGRNPRPREIGFAMQLDDARWSNRSATLRLRVEPLASAMALGPPTASKDHASRRATLSIDTLRSLVADFGGVFVREPSMPERAVDLDVRFETPGMASARLPDELLAQLRGPYDVVEVRATLLAVNGEADGEEGGVAVGFDGSEPFDVLQLMLEQADHSGIVSLATGRLADPVAFKVWPLSRSKADGGSGVKVESVTLRLEPMPGATPVP
jgi:hypothetical protein